MTERQTQSVDYWGTAFVVEEADLEYLSNLLLEEETPLTTAELTRALIQRRCDREAEAMRRRHEGAAVYLPREAFGQGQLLTFPALAFASGRVVNVRAGHNPDRGEFDVLRVDFENGQPLREFAARLADHKLNDMAVMEREVEAAEPGVVFETHGAGIAAKLEARLEDSGEIVRLAGRWFPRALLVNVNEGHRNLAEAVLDVAGGGPLPAEAILKELGLPDNGNPRLLAFSFNYALQADERFDEVGPSGQVLWYLQRLEPAEVRSLPDRLRNSHEATPGLNLSPALQAAAAEIEDEWSPAPPAEAAPDEVLVTLTYPHRRAGTLPLNARLAQLFPTAIESPRIRLTLVDAERGEKFAGWVVRAGRYVYGLDEWYARQQFPAGGQLLVRRGANPGEVIIQAQRRKSSAKSEWVRTAAPGPDGPVRFETLPKKMPGINYDDLSLIMVDNPAALDESWRRSAAWPFDRLVAHIFRELAKLDTQGKVHARTLYAAVNVIRRCPPEPIFAELLARPYFAHVGDAYWRFEASAWTE